MTHNIDIVINVSDKDRIKSIPELYERISGKDEVEVITKFVMAFVRITREIHARELAELTREVSDDDIPF
jgi:hypothetical protein